MLVITSAGRILIHALQPVMIEVKYHQAILQDKYLFVLKCNYSLNASNKFADI